MRPCKEGCGAPAAEKQSRCYSCRNIHRKAKGKYFIPDPDKAKILFIDIETTPTLAWTWDVWNTNISVPQIVRPGGMMCFAAKWGGQEEVQFFSEWQEGIPQMTLEAWKLLNEADIVIHFYGSRFDVPHLNTEFLKLGYAPPQAFKQIDLKLAVSKRFKFVSNKLQFVSQVLGLEGKEEHEGFPLWTKCMDGDDDARKRMESYNKRDTVLLEEVYEVLLPWIPGHPSRCLYETGHGCPTCGSSSEFMIESGYAYTKMSKFLQWKCQSCNSFFRSTKRESGIDLTTVW